MDPGDLPCQSPQPQRPSIQYCVCCSVFVVQALEKCLVIRYWDPDRDRVQD